MGGTFFEGMSHSVTIPSFQQKKSNTETDFQKRRKKRKKIQSRNSNFRADLMFNETKVSVNMAIDAILRLIIYPIK